MRPNAGCLLRRFLPRPHALAVLALLVLFRPSLPLASPFYDPTLSWRTIETPHFSIHYHDGLAEIAGRVAEVAEEVHARLTQAIKWTPQGKTQIVVLDRTDEANGSATIFPYRTIRIFVAPPTEKSALDAYDDWLRTLLLHEYTHILHLDTVHGLPRIIRYLFGNVITPNGAQPQWVIEGFATYEETMESTGGRGRATFARMMLRMAALEGKFPPIDRAAGGYRGWPAGAIPYIFGAAFHHHLAERFGPERIADLYQAYAGRLIPYFIESNARAILGERLADLWEEWTQALRVESLETKARIEAEGRIEGERRTHFGFVVHAPRFSADGSSLFFATRDFDGPPRLRELDLESGRITTLGENISTESLDLSPDGDFLVLSQIKPYRRFYRFHDLYLFDLAERKLSRLTQGARVWDADLSPDGTRFVAVRTEKGQQNLVEIDRRGEKITPLSFSNDGTAYATPRWSPDGTSFVTSVKGKTPARDLVLYDGTATPHPLLCDGARNLQPTWSPDGRFLLYASDRTGISNLYALDLSSDTIYQVTNVVGGAFEPTISPDRHEIAYVGYHAEGFDIYLLPFAPEGWKSIGRRQPCGKKEGGGDGAGATPAAPDPAPPPEHPYRARDTLLPPTVLFPRFEQGSFESVISLETAMNDVLGYHSYDLSVRYGTGSQSVGGSGIYRNDTLAPTLFVGGGSVAVPTFVRLRNARGELLRGRLLLYERRSRLFGGISHLFPRPFPFRASLSYSYERRRPIGGAPIVVPLDPAAIPLTVETDPADLSGLRVALSQSNAAGYPNSVSPEKGRRIRLSASYWPDWLGSDFNQVITTFDWREYKRIPWFTHHALAFNLAGGAALGETLRQRTFYLGGALGESYFFPGASTIHVLRGYPDFIFSGQRMLVASAEYRFPLASVGRGYRLYPLFLDRIHALLFADYGNAFDALSELPGFHLGLGGEVKADLLLGYGFPLTLRLGAASALGDPDGEPLTFYLEFGTAF